MKNVIDTLIDAIKSKDAQKALEWSRLPEWLTVEQFYGAGGETHNSKISVNLFLIIKIVLKAQDHDMASAEPDWPCSQCTYLNEASANVCGICQSPRIIS